MGTTSAVVVLVFLIPLGLTLAQGVRDRALADAERRSSVVAGALTATTDAAAIRRAAAAAADEQARQPVVHGGPTGEPFTTRARAEDITRATAQGRPVVTMVPGGVVRLQPVPVDNGVAVVEVFVDDAALTKGLRAIWWTLAGVGLGLVLASVLMADRVAAATARSVRSLVKAATAVGDGDLDVRVSPSGPRELAQAGQAFNRMADRLVTSRTNERELVADLSHRLRTPLTALRLDADALDSDDTGAGTLTDAELDRRRTIRRIRQAIVTLEAEVDVLIKTTRKAVHPEPTSGVCDASEVVRDRMVFWSALAGDQNRAHKVIGAHTRIPVPLPRAELAAALDAVLGNVFRYTPQGTAFEVAVSRRNGYVAVRVDDAGPGIADPDRALRRGQSDKGSTGLGLDIARRAATAAAGSVSIDRARLGGASVVMLFADPAATPRQVSRFGLVGRLAREPGPARWPRPRHPTD